MLALKIGAPKERFVVVGIETANRRDDRLRDECPELPGFGLTDLPLKPIEGIGGVSKIVARNQPSVADIHGKPSKEDIGPQPGSQDIIHFQGAKQLVSHRIH